MKMQALLERERRQEFPVPASFPACGTQMCQRAGAGAEENLCANRRQSEKGRDREATNHSKDKQQRNRCAGTKETFEMLY